MNYRYALKFSESKNNTTVNINSMYLATWKDSLIPLCSDRSGKAPSFCSEFKPSLSDQGFCFTQNQAPLDDVFKPTTYIQTFKMIFYSKEMKNSIVKNKCCWNVVIKDFRIRYWSLSLFIHLIYEPIWNLWFIYFAKWGYKLNLYSCRDRFLWFK